MKVHARSAWLLWLTAGAAPTLAADGPPPVDQRDYARPQQLIDIGGGRRMNLFCKGSGSPTVVFDSGTGLAGWDWLRVHPAIARKTRACVYDRPGFGFSDPSPRAGTTAHAVDDLHRLLTAANVPPPYVLVGHSYGGMNVQLYAYTHPQQVVGLVNVDGGHEDEAERFNRITGGKFARLMAQYMAESAQCVAAAKTGISPGSAAFAQCIAEPPPMFGAPLAAAFLANKMSPAYWDAARSEEESEATSSDQLRGARKSFGDLPLVYLTRGISPFLVPGQPQGEMNKATERDVMAMHDEIARLSTRGRNQLVPGAGHSIHVDKPQAVIDAINEVLGQVRSTPQSGNRP